MARWRLLIVEGSENGLPDRTEIQPNPHFSCNENRLLIWLLCRIGIRTSHGSASPPLFSRRRRGVEFLEGGAASPHRPARPEPRGAGARGRDRAILLDRNRRAMRLTPGGEVLLRETGFSSTGSTTWSAASAVPPRGGRRTAPRLHRPPDPRLSRKDPQGLSPSLSGRDHRP